MRYLQLDRRPNAHVRFVYRSPTCRKTYHLDRTNQQYRKLMASVAELNTAPVRAAGRLKAD
jgi:hypothetical protein